MPTIRTRAAKTSALTHNEVDANFTRPSTQKTTTYTILVGDNRSTIEGNHASTPFTITLPTVAAAGAAEPGDFRVTVSNINAAAVTLDGSGAETIDGAANVVLEQWDSITVELDSAAGAWKTTSKVGSDQTVQDLTVSGAFTSVGIDDNATGERVQVADNITTFGAAGNYGLVKDDADYYMYLSGGTSGTTGADILLYGDNAGAAANDLQLRSGGNGFLIWDESAGALALKTGTGSKTQAFSLDGSQNATFAGASTITGLLTTTAGITSGSDIVSDTDSTDDLGTTSVRWANLFVDDITVTNGIAVPGQLYGLTTAHDTDTAHDVLINVGSCADSTNAEFMNLAAILTKRIDADWVAGDNAGGLSPTAAAVADTPDASTWWHYFLIKHTDGTVDAGWDTSLTCANLLTDSSYTYYRRIASHYVNASNNIDAYTQFDDLFIWDVHIAAASGTPSATESLLTLRTPTGIVTEAHTQASWASGVVTGFIRVYPTTQTDAAVSIANSHLAALGTNPEYSTASIILPTNTSSQINYRGSTASGSFYLYTNGWRDNRGKL